MQELLFCDQTTSASCTVLDVAVYDVGTLAQGFHGYQKVPVVNISSVIKHPVLITMWVNFACMKHTLNSDTL